MLRSGNVVGDVSESHQCFIGATFDTNGGFKPKVASTIRSLPKPPRQVGKRLLQGSIASSYRAIMIPSHEGQLPKGLKIGLFGATFIATGEKVSGRRSLIFHRAEHPDPENQKALFSLPIDLRRGAKLSDSIGVSSRFLRPTSSFDSFDGKQWWMSCRLVEDSLHIEQCQVDSRGETVKQMSPVEEFRRQIGDRHSVAEFSFRIIEIIVVTDQQPPLAWLNIGEFSVEQTSEIEQIPCSNRLVP